MGGERQLASPGWWERMARTAGRWDGAGMWLGTARPQTGLVEFECSPKRCLKKRRSRENLSSTFQPRAFNSNSARGANVPVKRCGVASSLGLKSRGQQEELEQTFGSFWSWLLPALRVSLIARELDNTTEPSAGPMTTNAHGFTLGRSIEIHLLLWLTRCGMNVLSVLKQSAWKRKAP